MKLIRLQMAGVVLAAALAASGCVSKGEYEKLEADKNSEIEALRRQRVALEQDLQNLQSQRMALERQQSNLRGEVSTLQKQRDQLEMQRVALERERAELEANSKQTQSQYDGLVRNLKDELKKGELQVRQYKDMLTVEVAEQLFFDSGKAALKDSGKEVLKRVGEALKGYDDKIIRVIGHTDNVPIATAVFPSNWELSVARATTVVRFLQGSGLPPERLVASGRGEYSPVASNDDADGRRKNRRIEITLIDRNLAQELQEKR
jgi:chemotaxis protein MotB